MDKNLEKLQMLRKEDEELVEVLLNKLKEIDKTDQEFYDHENEALVSLVNRMVSNLKIAPQCYRKLSKEDNKKSFYLAECNKCGWFGSSKFLDGGHQIADTGDYGDVYCPVCGNSDI